MNFFDALGDTLSAQYLGGELPEGDRTLSRVIDGKKYNYAKLGSYASQIDQSAQRKYLEEGYLRSNSKHAVAKPYEILMQQPEATLLVKKKMFSSLANNYDVNYMNNEEKIFMGASIILFRNKLKQLAAFEALSKIQTQSLSTGELNEQTIPFIFAFTKVLKMFGVGLGNFEKVIDKIQSAYVYSNANFYSTWIEEALNVDNLFNKKFGSGTGVLELNNFTSISTNTSLSGGGSGCNIAFTDPYELMVINVADIENAISEAINVNNRPVIKIGKETLDDIIKRKIDQLNKLRNSRGASSINFKINPSTIFGKRLIAIVERTGEEIVFKAKIPGLGSVKVEDPYLLGGAVLGNEGLDSNANRAKSYLGIDSSSDKFFQLSELSLFGDAVNSIYNKIAFETNTARSFSYAEGKLNSTANVNSVRKKMLFHYGGKNIVQPMDEIHVYISSKSRYDNKVLAGLQGAFSGLDFFQKLNNTVYDIKNMFTSIFKPSENIDFQTEKAAYTDASVPNYLWSTVRGYLVNDKAGTHVYAGVVTNSSNSYNNGSFTVGIIASDNSYYLTQGKINISPGADNFNGVLLDPLTPYETSFDSVYSLKGEKLKLLNENLLMLSSSPNQKPLLLFKDGNNVGLGVSKDNIYQEEIRASDGKKRKVFYAPDGLVYKWKEGIGILTKPNSNSPFDPILHGAPNTVTDPFAAQDVVNCISLLVTGQPYNFYNYYKAAIKSGGLINQNGLISTTSPLYILQNSLRKNNATWGNFIPFKSLNLDDQSYQFIINNRVQSLLNKQQKYLQELQNLEKLKREIILSSNVPGGIDDNIKQQGQEFINKTADRVNEYKQDFQQFIDSVGNNVSFSIIGNDVSFDYDPYFNNATGAASYTDQNYRTIMRKKLNFLTLRPSWKVRGNQDFNYFIIEDNYDKDYDLLAAEIEFEKNLSIFNKESVDVLSKIKPMADIYNLEFFCDTQGHLRLRMPTYNKIPSSVFYNMIQQQKDTGLQIFPQFLLEMYYNQISYLTNKISAIEDQIRLYCRIAGVGNDLSFIGDNLAAQFIRNSGINNPQNINSGNKSTSNKNTFDFTTFPATGEVNGNLLFFEQVVNPLIQPEKEFKNLAFIQLQSFNDNIKEQLNLGNTFDVLGRLQLTSNLLEKPENIVNTTSDVVVKDLLKRLQSNTGKLFKLDDVLLNLNSASQTVVDFGNSKTQYQVDIFRLTQNIAEKISERQKVLKTLYGISKNAADALSLEADPTQANNMLFPALLGNKQIPEFLQSMIEDESTDDIGPGSGKRYVIKNSQIISYDFSEQPPQFVIAKVQGRVAPGFTTNSLPPPPSYNAPVTGNPITTATAVDYDLWRMYGFKSNVPTFDIPVFRDPESQCAPYAATILSKARKEILKGSVTISGNEYMQPGDVIYLEQRGMLFYVESVSHNYNQGSSFTTRLSLSHGHYPGDYIPVRADLVGKMMYNNRDQGDVINYRQSSSKNEVSLGAFIIDPSLKEVPEVDQMGGANYAKRNITTLMNILTKANSVIESTAGRTDIKTTLVLKIYYDSSLNQKENNTTSGKLRDQVYQLIIGNSDIKLVLGKDALIKSLDINKDLDKVVYASIDFANPNRDDSPSQEAMNLVRDLLDKAIRLNPNLENNAKNQEQFDKSLEAMKKVNEELDKVNNIYNDNALFSAFLAKNSNNPAAYVFALKKYLNQCIVDCYIKTEYL